MIEGIRRLTAAELCEPDVVLIVVERKFYELPREAQELIRAYHSEFKRVAGVLHFTLAAYRWREEIEPLIPKGEA